MKCPVCKYVHGYNSDTFKQEDGKEGDFYKHPVEMKRVEPWDYSIQVLYGCPKCGIVFMDI